MKTQKEKRVLSQVLLFLCLVMPVACNSFPPSEYAKGFSLIPGECLASTELTHCTLFYGNPYSYDLEMFLDLKMKNELMSDGDQVISYYVPDPDVYDEFGKNGRRVKKEYDEIRSACQYANYIYPTIYKTGQLRITADKPFAGIPAGEELPFELFNNFEQFPPLRDASLDFNYYKQAVGPNCVLRFPTDGREWKRETVHFHVELPVKVGLFLTYLNDRIQDPGADMQFRDEVLTCDFAVNGVLQ